MRSPRGRLLAIALAGTLLASGTPVMARDEAAADARASSTGVSLIEALERLTDRIRVALDAGGDAITGGVAIRDGEGEASPPLARIARSGARASGAVALTFDDGWDRAACARIADTLREHDAVGTFFINGMHLQAAPERWRSILEGMPVGNHTRSHHDLTGEPHPVVIRQILHNEAIHERVLGRPMLKLLRPPYGAYGERIRRIAARLGYEHLALWSVDTYDWRPSASARRIAWRATRARSGSIILMHCSRKATAKALPAIIRHYESRGIRLVGLDELLGLDTATSAPEGGANAVRLIDS